MTADGVEALYPFLYATDGDVDTVLAEASRSTREKVADPEVLERRAVAPAGPVV